jgi:hypothetical protein
MEVDEIYLGTGEPFWGRGSRCGWGRERKKQTLDDFFEKHLSVFQRSAIRAKMSSVPWRRRIKNQLNWRCMTRSRSEASVSSNECSAESFGKHYIGGIIGRKIVTELPNAHEMRIASDPQVQQIANRVVRTV